MEEEPQDVVATAQETEKPKRKGSFAVGHPKYGGRQKKEKVSQKMWQAREIAEELDFHPLIEAIKIYRTGRLPSAPGAKAQAVSATARVRCLEQALAFLLPRLSHQSISSPDGGPIETVHLDLVELMRNPALAQAAQTLALGISNPDYMTPARQLEGPEEDQ